MEVHRLAVAGREPHIARQVGHEVVAPVWLATSRFADVETLATATLTLGEDAGAFYYRGWARSSTGQPRPALADYNHALTLSRDAGDRAGEATTLNNIGGIRLQQGDVDGAWKALRTVLELVRAVGDRATEAMASFNGAVLLTRMGRTDDAIAMLHQAIALAETTEHPALPAMPAFLTQIQQQQEG